MVILNRVVRDIKRMLPALLIATGYAVLMTFIFETACPIKAFLDVDCPGCGLTRGCLYVLSFSWEKAYQIQPFSFAWVILILYLLMERYICNRTKIYWEVPTSLVCIGTIVFYVLKIIR